LKDGVIKFAFSVSSDVRVSDVTVGVGRQSGVDGFFVAIFLNRFLPTKYLFVEFCVLIDYF